MKKELICINCPQGCNLNVEFDKEKIISLEGNECKMGVKYAEEEVFHPVRMVTTTAAVMDGFIKLLPVKTSCPIDKSLTPNIVKEISKIRVETPVKLGDIIIKNILNTGADILATRTVKKFYL